MVDRRPPKTSQRYQPLPKGQNVIIVTDKTQLIPKDVSLDDFKNPENVTASGAENTPSKAAPKPIKTIKPVDKDGECNILYSMGKLEAYLSIEPPLNEGKWPTLEDAIKKIEAENIVNYDQAAVSDAIEKRKTMPVTIARGKPAVKGKDTEIEFFYELRDLHKIYIEGLVVDSFGRVDYRQVKTVQTVSKGDIIAKKSMCTPGEDGIDVHGQIIQATPGIDKPIKLGKNVTWDEDGENIIATEGGKPTLSNNNIISVLPIHEIRGDVNFHTGNIVFNGNLVIYGNVESGFKVNADGDIVILGNVDAAEINCGGKLSIRGRVFGNDKGIIRCTDDFFAKGIEHVTLICNKNVTVHDAIMHSNVSAEGRISVETGKGWIVGGVIRAGEEISARTIGSKVGTITVLELGPLFKPPIIDADNIEGESEGLTMDNQVETIAQITLEPDTASNTDDSGQTPKAQGRIRFKDFLHSGVRVGFGFYKFIIQDDLTFGTLTCSDGYLHLLPYR